MSEYINIGWCKDYECFYALHSHIGMGIQWDDITGEITIPESRWKVLTSREQNDIQQDMESFVAGWEACEQTLQDKIQYHIDISNVDKTAPDVKEQLIGAAIKTEYGRKIIAKHMVGGNK